MRTSAMIPRNIASLSLRMDCHILLISLLFLDYPAKDAYNVLRDRAASLFSLLFYLIMNFYW